MKFSEEVVRNKQQNITWINNLRLISMFAVVVLHTASPLIFQYKTVSKQDWLVGDVYNALVRFAVPVFVMITGALLLHREYELSSFLKKRIGRLISPFLFWSLVYIAYQWYNGDIVFTNSLWWDIKLVLHQLQHGSFYHLWYVYLLIGLYLLIPVISKFVQHATEKELLYFLAVWFLTMLLSNSYLKKFDTAVDLHNFAGYLGYLVLGHYLTYKSFAIKNIALLSFLTFLCCVTLIATGTYYMLVTKNELSIFFYEPIGPFVVVFSASAFLMAKHLSVKLSPAIEKVFNNAGSFTLGIYLSHALILTVFEIFEINYTIFTPILSIPLIALSCFLLSWLLVYGLSKVPLLKYVVG
jgi:surface polysaccharide O-acyltransferase-like enzyme